MENEVILEFSDLTDDELLELFGKVEEHRKYLDSSILVVEEESEEESDESTK